MSNDYWYGPVQIEMKRNVPLKRKTPLRRASIKRAAQYLIYRSLAKYFLYQHPYCEIWTESGVPFCLRESEQVHHMKGRGGSLLCDTRYFLAVCQDHHKWIEDHKNEARKRKLILY